MLLQLPLRKILTVQRVCKGWKEAIKLSPQIQKALFFRPIEDVQLRLVDAMVSTYDCSSNSDCLRIQERWNDDSDDASDYARWYNDGHDRSEYRILVNPFLGNTAASPTTRLYFSRADVFSTEGTYQRPEASWRKMLLTQPPLEEVKVKSGAYLGRDHWHKLRACRGSRGLTLDDSWWHANTFGTGLREICGEEKFAELDLRGASTPAEFSGQIMLEEMARKTEEEEEEGQRSPARGPAEDEDEGFGSESEYGG